MSSAIGLFRRCAVPLLLALCAAAGAQTVDPKDLAVRAEAAYQAGDLPTAMGLFRQAAEAGNPVAQARLADMLDAAEQDAEAVEWYRKSAAQDEPAGVYGLGRMIAIGEGVKRDAEQALAMYRRAAQKDYPPAIEALARAYRVGGLGLPKDLAEAQRLEARAKALRDAAKGSR